MAKFPFIVKHNGTIYEAGKEVPIGIEIKKEDEIADKSANEIREELKLLGVNKFPSNKKEDLMKQLEEALKENEKSESESESESDETLENENEEIDNVEANNDNENEDEESKFLDQIINEE